MLRWEHDSPPFHFIHHLCRPPLIFPDTLCWWREWQPVLHSVVITACCSCFGKIWGALHLEYRFPDWTLVFCGSVHSVTSSIYHRIGHSLGTLLPSVLFLFFFTTPRGLQDLSSPTTRATAVKVPSPIHWTAREVLYWLTITFQNLRDLGSNLTLTS